MKIINKVNILFFILMLYLYGCGAVVSKLPPAEKIEYDKVKISSFEIGRSVENRNIECIVMGEGRDVILFMASIHGDETAGTALILSLVKYLQDNPDILIGKKAVFLPVVNPDGVFRDSRYNSNGIDLNRNFLTANRINKKLFGLYPVSEPETHAIVRVIELFRPNRILSFHQPLNCIDFDGPGKHLAQYLSSYCNLKITKLGARPGSLGSYAGEELLIPTITIELPQETESFEAEGLWQKYGKILIAAIQYNSDIIISDTLP
ncbi:Peptidase, M14 family [Desulfonema limicola]|uniref:Peptidase, M14 family n=1 Tax=Desulfonema limicola TaxID=45656 RepID=A0A975BBX9_9BACT|nr:M14 family zinc carboxypeptidase [Desulfonema limicola]QTA82521.1 Peptidase, M14 family [Desulfonema limicola]